MCTLYASGLGITHGFLSLSNPLYLDDDDDDDDDEDDDNDVDTLPTHHLLMSDALVHLLDIFPQTKKIQRRWSLYDYVLFPLSFS